MLQLTAVFELARSIRRSAFRLETRSEYRSRSEVERFSAFREGRPLPPRNPDTDPWLRNVVDKVAVGCIWRRVHADDRPPTQYLRFEFRADEASPAVRK